MSDKVSQMYSLNDAQYTKYFQLFLMLIFILAFVLIGKYWNE